MNPNSPSFIIHLPLRASLFWHGLGSSSFHREGSIPFQFLWISLALFSPNNRTLNLYICEFIRKAKNILFQLFSSSFFVVMIFILFSIFSFLLLHLVFNRLSCTISLIQGSAYFHSCRPWRPRISPPRLEEQAASFTTSAIASWRRTGPRGRSSSTRGRRA